MAYEALQVRPLGRSPYARVAKVKKYRLQAMIDNSYLRQLEESGFIDRPYQ